MPGGFFSLERRCLLSDSAAPAQGKMTKPMLLLELAFSYVWLLF